MGSPRGYLQAPSSHGAGTGPSVPSGAQLVSAALHLLGQLLCAPLPRSTDTAQSHGTRGGGRKNTEGCQPAAEFSPCGMVTEGQRSAASSCPPQQGGSGRSAGWRCCWQGPSPRSWMTAAPNYYSSFSFSRLRREAVSREVGCPRAGSVPKANRRGRVPAGFQLFHFFSCCP